MSSGMVKNILEQPAVLQRIIERYLDPQNNFTQLRNKRNLYIVGTGASLNAAHCSVNAFVKYANMVPTVLPASEIGMYTHLFDENSAVILISQSGDSYETKEMCRIMREKKLPFWGITNEKDSTLAKEATYPIFMEAGKEVSSATKTQTATLMLLFVLAGAGNFEAEQALRRIPSCVQNTIENNRSAIDTISSEYTDVQTMYILSDSINGATAKQGALMYKEKTRIMVEGMTASEFRHGAVEIVNKGLHVHFVAPSMVGAEESQTHIQYLSNLGCKITTIATKPFVGTNHNIIIEDCGEDAFSCLCATIPMQLLSESIARQKGYDPDGFVYLSKVVAEY